MQSVALILEVGKLVTSECLANPWVKDKRDSFFYRKCEQHSVNNGSLYLYVYKLTKVHERRNLQELIQQGLLDGIFLSFPPCGKYHKCLINDRNLKKSMKESS